MHVWSTILTEENSASAKVQCMRLSACCMHSRGFVLSLMFLFLYLFMYLYIYTIQIEVWFAAILVVTVRVFQLQLCRTRGLHQVGWRSLLRMYDIILTFLPSYISSIYVTVDSVHCVCLGFKWFYVYFYIFSFSGI